MSEDDRDIERCAADAADAFCYLLRSKVEKAADAFFWKGFGETPPEEQERPALTLEMLREAKASLGPPPPRVSFRLSTHVPAFIPAAPKAKPRTGDMQTMCDDIGPQKVEGGYVITSNLGLGDETIIVMNPVHSRGEPDV